jgi:hypothetical protein
MRQDLLSGLWAAQHRPDFSARDWELVLSQSRRSRLLARVARLYADRGWLPDVPDGPRQHLDSALRLVGRQRDEVLWEIDRIRHALRKLPIRVVLLKGAAYVAAQLPPWRGRLFSDVDILVAREQLPAVETALFAAGWIPAKLDPYDDRYYRQWTHELPPLQHVQRQTALDVHHTIAAPTSRFKIDGNTLMAHCQPLQGEASLAVLAPVDMVLHSALHLFQEGDFGGGVRDLLDIDDLLEHFGSNPNFWPELVARARELGAGVPLFHATFHLQRLFGRPVPVGVMDELQSLAPNRISRAVMASLLTVALRPDHPSCDSVLTPLSRQLLFIRSHYLRMPWYQIVPHLMRKAWMRVVAQRKPHEGL